MASLLEGSWRFSFIALLLFMSFFCSFTVFCSEFEVGGGEGWGIPHSSSKDDQLYNHWASNNRFKVNDTLRFEYKKDSVLEVSVEEYKECKSTHPIFFSNNGNTVFTLHRPGFFYFISGVTGHCQRGMKMIIKVLEPENPPQPSNDGGRATENHGTLAQRPPHSSTLELLIVSVFLFGEAFM